MSLVSELLQPRVFKDLSLWGLLFGNVFAMFMALKQGWDLGEIMWVYWAQSAIIGIIAVLRILSLKAFSTKDFLMNGKPVPETTAVKFQIAGFFAFHYGFFHLVYAVFLWDELALDEVEPAQIQIFLLCVTGFAVSHGFSLLHNLRKDFRDKKPNIGELMGYPYLRIIPMHITIIFGGLFGGGLFIFMALKSFADAGMHVLEHHLFRTEKRDQ